VLTYVNNYEKWKSEFDTKFREDETEEDPNLSAPTKVEAMFTSNGNRKGWNSKGLNLYEELVDRLELQKKAELDESLMAFEDRLLQRFAESVGERGTAADTEENEAHNPNKKRKRYFCLDAYEMDTNRTVPI